MKGSRIAVVLVLSAWFCAAASQATAQGKSKQHKKTDKRVEQSKGAEHRHKHDYRPKEVGADEYRQWKNGIPPGWSRGNKTGWNGAGVPPGQLEDRDLEARSYPPEAERWSKRKKEDWDRQLEESKKRVAESAAKHARASESDRRSAEISVENAARHGVPMQTAEETVDRAIKRGMPGADIERITRAMAYGAGKAIDQERLGVFTRQAIDSGKAGEDVALAVYQEVDARHQASVQAAQKKSPWWKRLFGR